MKIGINVGHTKIGTGVGASKYLNESTETRIIACEVMSLLAKTDHEVYYLGIDKSNNNLKYVVDEANNKKIDLFVSIHLNAGGGQGSEVYTYKGRELPQAKNIVTNLNRLGFKNRGIKNGSNLYVIKHTKMTSILIEVCFVDSRSDVTLYNKLGYRKIAEAIVNAIK